MLAALAVAWPIARHWSWSREVLANLDYIRALHALDRGPNPAFPVLSGERLWAKDLYSGRELKRRLCVA